MIASALFVTMVLTGVPPDSFESGLVVHRARSGHDFINGVLNVGLGNGAFDSRTHARYRIGIDEPRVRHINIVANFRRPLYVTDDRHTGSPTALFDTIVRTPSKVEPLPNHGVGTVIIESATPVSHVYRRVNIDRLRITHRGDHVGDSTWRRRSYSSRVTKEHRVGILGRAEHGWRPGMLSSETRPRDRHVAGNYEKPGSSRIRRNFGPK